MNAEIVYFGPELHISVPAVIEVYDTFRRMEDNNRACEISSSHGGEYDVQSCLLGCTAV
jgi:hypothetical protein